MQKIVKIDSTVIYKDKDWAQKVIEESKRQLEDRGYHPVGIAGLKPDSYITDEGIVIRLEWYVIDKETAEKIDVATASCIKSFLEERFGDKSKVQEL